MQVGGHNTDSRRSDIADIPVAPGRTRQGHVPQQCPSDHVSICAGPHNLTPAIRVGGGEHFHKSELLHPNQPAAHARRDATDSVDTDRRQERLGFVAPLEGAVRAFGLGTRFVWTSLTRKRSDVQILQRPHLDTPCQVGQGTG